MREHDIPGHRPHSLGTGRMVRDDPAAFEAMTTAELKRMCIDLSIAAALAVPGGAGQAATETDERFHVRGAVWADALPSARSASGIVTGLSPRAAMAAWPAVRSATSVHTVVRPWPS